MAWKMDTTDTDMTKRLMFWAVVVMCIYWIISIFTHLRTHFLNTKFTKRSMAMMEEAAKGGGGPFLVSEDERTVSIIEVNKLAKRIRNTGEKWEEAQIRAKILLEDKPNYLKNLEAEDGKEQ